MVNVLPLSCIAWMIATIAYVYSVILTEPKMLLFGWYKFLERRLMPKYWWLFKPLVDCDRCVAGQLAFWSFFLLKIHTSFMPLFHVKQFTYAPFEHFYFVSLCILFTVLIKKSLE